MTDTSSERFFDTVPVFDHFEGVADIGNYKALPDDWLIATSDIVGSTKAIEAGRYKAVNMAGASVISALLNVFGHRNLAFVFGGDGALVAVPGSALEKTAAALAAVQAWVKDELGLNLRAAIVPVGDIRRQGHDVRVARFRAAEEVHYAMFAGGGASWAEAEMKAGRYAVEPASPGTRPDLTGLSCRWNPIASRHGEIVSIIAMPGHRGAGPEFRNLVSGIVNLAAGEERGGHPVPPQGPEFSFPPIGLDYELRAAAPKHRRFGRRLAILAQSALGAVLFKFGGRLGRFDARLYKTDVASNSDFRKFDDGLKMTIDVDSQRFRAIEQMLEEASKSGVCRYGLHRQDSALMTCIVPSPMTRDHIHFIDGAAGGYAMAASQLKGKG